MVTKLRTEDLQFTIFDDNVPLNHGAKTDDTSDIVGYAKIKLNGLMHNEVIDIATDIKNRKNAKVGTIFFKMFWFEGANQLEKPK